MIQEIYVLGIMGAGKSETLNLFIKEGIIRNAKESVYDFCATDALVFSENLQKHEYDLIHELSKRNTPNAIKHRQLLVESALRERDMHIGAMRALDWEGLALCDRHSIEIEFFQFNIDYTNIYNHFLEKSVSNEHYFVLHPSYEIVNQNLCARGRNEGYTEAYIREIHNRYFQVIQVIKHYANVDIISYTTNRALENTMRELVINYL